MPRLADPGELWPRVAAARVARLATLRADGSPRLVPVTFAVVDGLICSAVDAVKPKSSPRLARLADVRRDPRVTLLIDRYDEDWTELWWVRIDGTAEVHQDGSLREEALAALAAKYRGYRTHPPDGELLVLTPRRVAGWTASER
ncbi:TIGR03668 family PPOX class F420-dependent oxidoreductase [soil metagenome]